MATTHSQNTTSAGGDTLLVGRGAFPIASEYLTALLNVAVAHGVSPSACLAGSGLVPDILIRPPAQVGHDSMRAVVTALLQAIPLETLACDLVARVGVFNHGALSLLLQSSASLEDALAALSLYADTRTAGKVVRLQERATYYELEVVSIAEPRVSDDRVDQFVVLSTLLMMAQGVGVLLASDTTLGAVITRFEIVEPDKVRALLPRYQLHDGQLRNAVQLLKTVPFQPVISDRSVRIQAQKACADQKNTQVSQGETVDRVRFELSRRPLSLWHIDVVADALCMCPRTLQRKLAQAGTGFRQLKSDEQRHRACYFLLHTPLSVESISQELGYAHPSNFVRWFRGEVGQSPVEYRAVSEARGA